MNKRVRQAIAAAKAESVTDTKNARAETLRGDQPRAELLLWHVMQLSGDDDGMWEDHILAFARSFRSELIMRGLYAAPATAADEHSAIGTA